MQFDRGYASAYTADDTDKIESILDNPYILITDKKITNIQEILPILEQVLEGSIVVDRLKCEEVGIGFDAVEGTWVNMMDAGIVYPTKVTHSALQNTASVAAMFLATEAVVTDIPEPAGQGGGMMQVRCLK